MGPIAFGIPSAPVTALNPLPVTGLGSPNVTVDVLAAGENHIGEVGTPGDVISVTPTVSASPDYEAGDAVGGIQTLTSAARVTGGRAVLESITIIDKSNQKKALTILFFDANPAAATVTDNTAFAFSTDIAKFIGKVNVVAGDYETINSIGIATLKAIGLELEASGSANLYAVIVAGEAINLATVGDYIFRYGFLQL